MIFPSIEIRIAEAISQKCAKYDIFRHTTIAITSVASRTNSRPTIIMRADGFLNVKKSFIVNKKPMVSRTPIVVPVARLASIAGNGPENINKPRYDPQQEKDDRENAVEMEPLIDIPADAEADESGDDQEDADAR